ncbi:MULTISPECIES: methyl-accepting chemotaxis protein [unclassified Methanoregula]|uniref:HAMP domain-containing methyl-accepting chemotaxis protein n=1 Tax=unclassified Methanoregula TaxID=2649730 RepID=UPI0009D3DC5D|nr:MULTISPECIES: methyl-accepting chemotaxis protein [unclassified Methanoregula]OPX65216.1 MAG: Sensory rhodopsin I transducer [Methanoregula sp. PtaB.Bin085]OPY32125.1 MAG: Sensory rhodopsin I transducer [Methanoregula sp. PtaU1.Bin006]
MSFIDDMKIGKKLIGGFVIVLLIMAMIAAYGYMSAQDAASRSKVMYETNLAAIDKMGLVSADFQQMRAEIYRYIYVPAARSAATTTIDGLKASIRANIDSYSNLDLTDKDKAALNSFETNYATFITEYDKTIKAADANDMKTVDAQLAAGSPLITSRTNAVAAYKEIIKLNQDNAAALNKASGDAAAAAALYMAILSIAGILIGIGVALYMARSITAPIEQVGKNLKELSNGHLGNRLKLSRKDEIGEMAAVMDQFSDDLQNNVIGTMKKIADGDLSTELKAKDIQDEITPALMTTTNSLRALVSEAGMLSKAAVAGQLSTRGNADKFKGGYREVIVGINQTLDGVVAPVNEAMRVSGEYAQGNFTARVDEKLNVQGDFVKFKEALNNVGIQVSKALTIINQQVGDLAASAEEANASVEEVSAGSAQVAKNASGVSVNAEKATQGVEQVQKAMEDLSRTIQDVATKSELVAKIVQDTTNYSREGMELARKTEQGMQGITKSSNDVNQIILEIKAQMDKISEIVNLITDLANQTNLLALNAAIEAARAGDAGRGFAVVATEVKSLAVESRASAERISEMIDNLQKQTLSAVDAVSAANTGVKEGSAALHETLTSFNNIVTSIDKISQNVSDVAAAAEEQAASVEEVTASVNEVGGLMQNTTREATDAAAASEESSAAIDQITKVVANVNTIVDKVTKEVSRFKC